MACKDVCLNLKNTTKRPFGYNLDATSGGVFKYCKECEYFIFTNELRCVCCHNKMRLKNATRREYRVKVSLKNRDENYDKKVNGLLRLPYL